MNPITVDSCRAIDDGSPLRVVLDGEAVGSVGRGRGSTDADLIDSDVIDADGLFVAPGFVDLQINGGFGIDLTADPWGMWELGRHLPSTGVTAFQPTIISSPSSVREAALAAIRDRPVGYVGAEPLGLHFEGPMLAPARHGAHEPTALRPADPALVATWSRPGGISMVTLAPELPGAAEVIHLLTSRGIAVSMGHTEATVAETTAAIDAGASFVTHLFNAMAPLHHREPGIVGTALTDDRLTVGLIADGVHLDPRTASIAWSALGPDRLVLVTDAVAEMGDGDLPTAAPDEAAGRGAVTNGDGVLVGSVLRLDQAVRNLVAWTGCDPADAVRCVTATPADAVGAVDRGRIVPGAPADLVLLDDDLTVAVTICRGEVAHVAESAIDRVPPPLLDGSSTWRS
jgi:N-acetylglucosamine-6-phosphate deacetylase